MFYETWASIRLNLNLVFGGFWVIFAPTMLVVPNVMNFRCRKLVDCHGEYLIFAVKRGTADSVLWKTTIRICVLRVGFSMEFVWWYAVRQFLTWRWVALNSWFCLTISPIYLFVTPYLQKYHVNFCFYKHHSRHFFFPSDSFLQMDVSELFLFEYFYVFFIVLWVDNTNLLLL